MITLLLDNYQDKRNGERKSHHFFYYGSASVVAVFTFGGNVILFVLVTLICSATVTNPNKRM